MEGKSLKSTESNGGPQNVPIEDLLVDGGLSSNDISYEWVQQNQDLQQISSAFPIHQIGEQIKSRDLDIEFRVGPLIHLILIVE